MIKVRPGHERLAFADLRQRPEVIDVYRLFGEYDFFLVMQAEGKTGFNQILKEISEKEEVIQTGPILLTADGNLTEMAFGEMESATTLS